MNDIYSKFAEKLISHKDEVVGEFITDNPHRDSKEIKDTCLYFLSFIENRYFMRELFKEPNLDIQSIFDGCNLIEPIAETLNTPNPVNKEILYTKDDVIKMITDYEKSVHFSGGRIENVVKLWFKNYYKPY